MFEFTNSPIPIRTDLTDAFRHVWNRLGAPGTWWTGEQRVALAAVARAAYVDRPTPDDASLTEPARSAAELLAKEPAAVTEGMILEWESRGLDSNHYIELIAVVSQVTTVDTFHRAMGLDLEPLPTPHPGEPSRALPDSPARKTKAWVPMVGPPTIPASLSAVPAEMAALEALSGPAYLSYQEMSDPAIRKALSRAQMELVAGRTSAINECFY